jgi:16S rRNA C967 or C1407 C5-methylase (RsmB/RsmF family)
LFFNKIKSTVGASPAVFTTQKKSYERFISGLVVSVVDPQPGETIVDCCAAPGGKTLFMASRLSGEGKKMEWTEGFNFLMMF